MDDDAEQNSGGGGGGGSTSTTDATPTSDATTTGAKVGFGVLPASAMPAPPPSMAAGGQAKPAAAAAPAQRTGVFDKILETIGGGPKRSYSVDPETGKTTVTESQPSRGDLFRHVIAGMLTGLARGAQERGPGAGLRSFAAGAGATMDQAQALDEQKRERAQQDAKNQSDATLRQAQIHRYNFEELMALRQNTRADQDEWDKHMESQMQLTKQLGEIGAQRLPVIVNGKDINQGDVPGNDPDLMKAYSAGQIKAPPGAHLLLTTTRNDDGEMIHHVWSVADDVMNTPIPVPPDIKDHYKLPDNTAPMPLRQVLNLTANMNDQRNNDINVQLKQEQIQEAKEAEKQHRAETGKAIAETAKVQEETRQLQSFDNKTDMFGNPVGGPGVDRKEYLKRYDEFSKGYVKDLNQLEKASNQMDGIIANAQRTGKLPGADSVVGIFDAIGISSEPLKGRGFRINRDIVGEHIGTRNILQDAAVKLQKYSPDGTGQIVTLQQLQDYNRILQQARHDAYLGASDEAKRQNLAVDFLPKGNNQRASDAMLKLYLDAAGGNAKTAETALKQAGWQ